MRTEGTAITPQIRSLVSRFYLRAICSSAVCLLFVLCLLRYAVAEDAPVREHDEAICPRTEDAPPQGPLSLRDCIEISLYASPNVVAAQDRIEQAHAAVEQAQSGFYPRLSIGETFVRTDYPPAVFSNKLAQANLTVPFPPPPGVNPFDQFNNPGPFNNWNTQLLFQWPVFQGGRTFYGNRAAIAAMNAAELDLKTIHNDLSFAVAAAYYEILKTERSIQIAEESVRQIRSHLDIATARYENDVALKSDVLRVQVSLAEAENGLTIARHNLERAKSRLNLAMGQPVNSEVELAGEEPSAIHVTEPVETLEELTLVARRQRAEILGMDRNLIALENSVSTAKAGYYPQINAFAHYDIDTEDFSDSNDTWTIGFGANLSIFDGFLTRSAVRAARAKLHEAEARKQQLLLQIDMDVKNSYLARSEAVSRLGVLEHTVAEAEETQRIVTERYREGMALVTDLLDSDVALTNARLQRLSAQYEYLVAVAALDRAVGRNIVEGSGQ